MEDKYTTCACHGTGPAEAPKKVVIYLTSGRSFTFYGVTNYHRNETAVTFDYKSQADGATRNAVFIISNGAVAGVASSWE